MKAFDDYNPDSMTRMDVINLVDDLSARAIALSEIMDGLGALGRDVAPSTFQCLGVELEGMALDLGEIAFALGKGKDD